MLAPSIFGMNDLFDDFGDVFEFSPAFRKQVAATRSISSDTWICQGRSKGTVERRLPYNYR